MSVESSEALERSVLEGKDRDALLRIAEVLGVKAGSRTKKAEIVDRILEQTGAAPARTDAAEPATKPASGRSTSRSASSKATASATVSEPEVNGDAAGEPEEPPAEWEVALGEDAGATSDAGDGGGAQATATDTAPAR